MAGDGGNKIKSREPVWKPRFPPDIGRLPYPPENRSDNTNDSEAANAFYAAADAFRNSPEIARFDGLVCRLFNEYYDPPVIYVWVGDRFYCISIFMHIPIPEAYAAPDAVAQSIRNWLAMEVPGSGRTVEDLATDQWLHIRNKQPVEHVPTPDEINAMERPTKRSRRASKHRGHYAIKRIEILPNYHLQVWFKNGDVKIVDIKAMRGDSSLFDPVWADFEKVEAHVYYVAWPLMFPSGPNTIEIRDQDIWEAGVDAGSSQDRRSASSTPNAGLVCIKAVMNL